MKPILKYSDNLSSKELTKLISVLRREYKQTLEYFDACAKRMGRYAKKNKPLKHWPRHVRDKYNFVTGAHNQALSHIGEVYTT